MNRGCRPEPTSGRPSEAESRADYLFRIERCAHDVPAERGPGWICGGCGLERSEVEAIESTEAAA